MQTLLSSPRIRRCTLYHLRLHVCTIVFLLSFLFILFFELDHTSVSNRPLTFTLGITENDNYHTASRADRGDTGKNGIRTRWPSLLAELKSLIPLRLLAHLNNSSATAHVPETVKSIQSAQSSVEASSETRTTTGFSVSTDASEISIPHVVVSAAVSSPLSAPTFTIVSLLRDMNVPDSSTSHVNVDDVNAVRYSIQMNSLRSWQRLLGGPKFNSFILVFMDSQQSCSNLIQMGTRVHNASDSSLTNVFDGIQCLPIPCWDPESKRPLLHCLFDKAHEVAATQMVLYVNGDIILNPLLRRRLDFVENEMHGRGYERLMAVGRRIDFPLSQEFITSYLASDNTLDQMIEYAANHGTVHGEFGLDVFFYAKSIFEPMSLTAQSMDRSSQQIQFPPFLAGVFRWDNWLLAECILRGVVETIDLAPNLPSPIVDLSSPPLIESLILHQNDPIRSGHRTRAGAETNEQLARQRSNTDYMYGTTTNCKWQLQIKNPCKTLQSCGSRSASTASVSVRNEEESQSLVPNPSQSLPLQFRQVSTKSRTLIAFPISQHTFQRSLFDHYLCQISRASTPLTNAVFIVDNNELADEIRRRLMEWKNILTDQRGANHSNQIPTPAVFAMPTLPSDVSVDGTSNSRRKLSKLNPLFQFLSEQPLNQILNGASNASGPESALRSLEFDLFYLNVLRHIQSNSFHVLHCDMFASSFISNPTAEAIGSAGEIKSGLVWSGRGDLLSHLENHVEGKGRPVDLVVIKPRSLFKTEIQITANQSIPTDVEPLRQPIPLDPSLVLIQSSKMAQYWLSLSKECVEQHITARVDQLTKKPAHTTPVGYETVSLPHLDKFACMTRMYEKLHASQLVSLEFDRRRFPRIRTTPSQQLSAEVDTTSMMWIDNRKPVIAHSGGTVGNDSGRILEEAQMSLWKQDRIVDTSKC